MLERMRNANRTHLLRIRDLGFLPEGEIHRRSVGTTPYEMGHDPAQYPLEEILEVADMASSLDPSASWRLAQLLSESNEPAIRYWAALGLLMRGEDGVAEGHDPLIDALEDESDDVAIVAAEALGRYGAETDDLTQALPILIRRADATRHDLFTAMAALNAIDELDEKALPIKERIAALPVAPDPKPGAWETTSSGCWRRSSPISSEVLRRESSGAHAAAHVRRSVSAAWISADRA